MGRRKSRSRSKRTKAHVMIHAQRRAMERYGFTLHKHMFQEMSGMVKRNAKGAQHLYSQTNTRSVWSIDYHDQHFVVVYNKQQHVICTFLTHEMMVDNFLSLAEND